MDAADGTPVALYRWLPGEGQVRGVVHIAHGAAEHARRYDRLARVLNGAGFAVYADDHRGHGATAGSLDRAGVGGDGAWDGMVTDAIELTALAAAAHPGVPVVLVGHSMGSFVAQEVVLRGAPGLAAVALSGSSGTSALAAADMRQRLVDAVAAEGRDVASAQFDQVFAGHNQPFVDSAPDGGPTGFEWLSRDHDEVRLYVDDPWCGFPLSNGFVLDMSVGRGQLWDSGRATAVPADLPILILSGDQDPVGRFGDGVRELTARYRDAGLDVTEVLYPGARHEVFNETNRDEVHHDLLTWLDRVLLPAAG